MTIINELILTTEQTIETDFLSLVLNDGDFNGENGDEYTSKKALKHNLTDQAYAVHSANLKSNILSGEKKITTFVKTFMNHWMSTSSDYYESFDFEIKKVPNSDYYAVTIVIIDK